jgi:hypothetical protein
MFDPNSLQFHQILPKITGFFCPRLIVVDGLVLSVSTAAPFRSSGNRVWIPSTTEIIPFDWISHQTHIKSIAFEIGSKLKKIQEKAFCGTDLTFFTFSRSITFLDSKCFRECKSLSSVRFESESRLSRIHDKAFSQTSLVEIIIPSSVEVLGEECFSFCGSRSSVRFESGSNLS